MTWRKLAVLVPQLPPESATATALRLDALDEPAFTTPAGPPHDPETEQWSRGEQLMASIRDELHAIRWLYTSAHSDPKKPPKWTPEPLPRPGMAPTAKPELAPAQISKLAAHLQRLQGNEETTYN